jgi:hypothetical protein
MYGEKKREETQHQHRDQLLEGVVGGVLKGGEEKNRAHMGSDRTLVRQRKNKPNEEREEVEICCSHCKAA